MAALLCCTNCPLTRAIGALLTAQAPHISLALAGVEIISNGSGSHHQLRKLDTRLDLIKGATAKVKPRRGVQGMIAHICLGLLCV
jgi:hypothetical protein